MTTPQLIRVTSLHVYPLKSAHRIDLAEAALGRRGLVGDREWMSTDAAGRFLTQRTHPALAQIRASFEGEWLRLEHPRLEPLRLPRAGDPSWQRRRIRVWNDEVDAAVAGAEACAWISQVTGSETLLVRAGEFTARQPSGPWRGDSDAPINFPDGYPLLVCNMASLEHLNSRLPRPVPMSRFRPNLVIEGLAAFGEDEVEMLQFGAVRLRLVKPCTRCVITTIDQESGAAADNPLEALKAFRFDPQLRGVTFGQNALLADRAGGTLKVGDAGFATARVAGAGAGAGAGAQARPESPALAS